MADLSLHSVLNNVGILELLPALQTYGWGMTDPECLVGRLTKRQARNHAEAWYGGHKDGPARLAVGNHSLADILARFPMQLLGSADAQLYLLVKALSVGEPLSLQGHPGTHDAIRLHRSAPDKYPDEVPKFEAGIALTPTELLYGFRSPSSICAEVRKHPMLQMLLGPCDNPFALSDDAFHREIWRHLSTTSPGLIQRCCEVLFEKLRRGDPEPHESWILKLQEKYPQGDIGLPFFFLLNHVRLNPGQAIPIPTGRLHAYLAGEFAEVMLPGNDTYRAGMTTKDIDFDAVSSCSEFTTVDLGLVVLDGRKDSNWITSYDWGFPFLASRHDGAHEYAIRPSRSAQILLSIDAHGTFERIGSVAQFAAGSAFLIPVGSSVLKMKMNGGTLLRFGSRN